MVADATADGTNAVDAENEAEPHGDSIANTDEKSAADVLEGFLDEVDPDSTGASSAVLRLVQHRSGPLPSADELLLYKDVYDGLPAEIVQMAIAEQKHRHRIEDEVIVLEKLELKGKDAAIKRGQYLGFSIAALILALSVVLALNGRETLAVVIAGVDVLGLVALFLGARVIERKQPVEPASDEGEEP